MKAGSKPLSSDREHLPELLSLPQPPEIFEAGLEPALSVQLIDQTSHLTLSASGNGSESSSADDPSPYELLDRGDSMTPLVFALSAVQSCPEMEDSSTTLPAEGTSGCTRYAIVQSDGDGNDAMAIDRPETQPPTVVVLNTCSSNPEQTVTFVAGQTSTAFDPDFDPMSMSLPIASPTANTKQLCDLPTEVLFHILGYLDVSDLLATSRTSHLLRALSLAPILHHLRLRRTRAILPPMLTSPSRPSLADLIRRSIFMTHTTVVSRKLARSLVSIRLSRRLAARPSAEVLVERCVLPRECLPGRNGMPVAPALVARKRAVERERVKDGLRRWVGSVFRGEVQTREEGVRRWEERVGVGRVWRMRRFWERMSGSVGTAGGGDDRRG